MSLSVMNMLGLSSSVTFHTYSNILSFALRTVLCQYRLYRADHAYLTYLMLQRLPSLLNGRNLDHLKV
jgi:hypothetical protein